MNKARDVRHDIHNTLAIYTRSL